jgi:hypothetical protein
MPIINFPLTEEGAAAMMGRNRKWRERERERERGLTYNSGGESVLFISRCPNIVTLIKGPHFSNTCAE